jgi:hypothetical protein
MVEQFAAFTNKMQSLSMLLQLSASWSLPIADLFNAAPSPNLAASSAHC